MTEDNHTIHFNWFLSPLAFLYGIGVRLRNRLFDWGLLRSGSFDVPVISVGNLAVGGTGKTPHTEYIVRLLKDRYRIAVLSRGYKRKSRGYVLAHPGSTSEEIGDEPYQIYRKFPDILVAVDANRCRGIRRLLALPEATRPEVILLDDAFQHRYVRPTLNIVLTDFHRPYYIDKLLPVGRLREPASGIRRADAVIVTKCEPNLQASDLRAVERKLAITPGQESFFSRIRYGELTPVFPGEASERTLRDLAQSDTLLLSGIAHPEYFQEEIRKYTDRATLMAFPDHHAFGKEDFRKIQAVFDSLSPARKRMIVTEKDAARLRDNPLLPPEWRASLYFLPITIDFPHGQEERFNELIDNHIIHIKNNHISHNSI